MSLWAKLFWKLFHNFHPICTYWNVSVAGIFGYQKIEWRVLQNWNRQFRHTFLPSLGRSQKKGKTGSLFIFVYIRADSVFHLRSKKKQILILILILSLCWTQREKRVKVVHYLFLLVSGQNLFWSHGLTSFSSTEKNAILICTDWKSRYMKMKKNDFFHKNFASKCFSRTKHTFCRKMTFWALSAHIEAK